MLDDTCMMVDLVWHKCKEGHPFLIVQACIVVVASTIVACNRQRDEQLGVLVSLVVLCPLQSLPKMMHTVHPFVLLS